MLVAAVSDTHGNLAGMQRLSERLKAMGITTLLHLGDDYRDLAAFAAAGLNVIGVPGLYCPEYLDQQIPNRMVVELGGVKLLLGHTGERHRLDPPADPDPERLDQEVHLVLYGHTHIPAVEQRQGVVWVNPGHLRDRIDRGYPPTFALMSLGQKEAMVQIKLLEDGATIFQEVYRFRP